MSSLKKIGVYGGTFDPFHHAHLILAEWAVSRLCLNSLYFIPAKVHAFKKTSVLSPAEVRYEMISAAIKSFPNLKVSRIEIDRSSTSFTIDTLREIRSYESLGNSELIYLIGSDNLAEFHLWKEHDEIFNIATISVFRRPNFNNPSLNEKYKNKIVMLDSPLISISATEIRNRIKENKPYQSLVPQQVYDIIENNGLYKAEK